MRPDYFAVITDVTNWLGADSDAWSEQRADAKKLMVKNDPAPIIASDIEEEAIEASKKNASHCGRGSPY